MPEYRDPYDLVLKPEIKCERPVWFPSWKEYKGPLEWWGELGHKDIDLRAGKRRGVYFRYKEEDVNYWDPRVPDGTSLSGPQGLDSQYNKDTTRKLDIPGNFYEFQRAVRENSSQYKQIAEKWEISKEHPGIDVNPTLDSITRLGHLLGTNWWLYPKSNIIKQFYIGPRFWDKPMNEGCLEKGLAMVKYSLPISLAHHVLDITGRPQKMPLPLRLWPLVKQWFIHVMPLPTFLAFAFGCASCASATIRHKDDAWNWTIASSVAGAFHTTIRNNKLMGLAIAAVGSGAGLFFQHLRLHINGLHGTRPPAKHTGGWQTGPLNWKYLPSADLASTEWGIRQSNRPF